MTYKRRIVAQIARLGTKVTVHTHSQSGTDKFGNPTHSYSADRDVYCLRTYPNRNTELHSERGDRHRDKPVFVFPKGGNHSTPPSPEDRIIYNGRTYEMQAPTHYDTHVEFFGEVVQ